MKNFFQTGVKWCYSVTKLNYIVISTLLEQILVTLRVLQGVTSVTKSLDLLKILFGNKIVINVKNKSNEKKKIHNINMRSLLISVIIFTLSAGSTYAETARMPQKKSSIKWNPLTLILMPMCSKETINICTPLRVLMRTKPSSQTETSSQKGVSSQ